MASLLDFVEPELDDGFPALGPEADPQPWIRPDPFFHHPGVKPRGYQEACADAVISEWGSLRSTMAVMATGLGKTFTAACIARKRLHRSQKDFLFIAHRRELVEQTAKAMRFVNPEYGVGVEMADQYAGDSERCRIVVASKDTISKGHRLDRFGPDRFGEMVIDECHLYTHRNKSYQSVVDRFPGAKLLGLTATPDRHDEYSMGRVFDSVAYRYDIQQAIPDGWLVPVVQKSYRVEGLNLSHVEAGENGDLDQAQVAEEMRRDTIVQAVAAAAVEASNFQNRWAARRPTLIFAASVQHAKDIASVLNLRHARFDTGAAASVDCEQADNLRDGIIERFRSGKIQYLVNFGVLTTGFDAPETRVIVIARPTQVRSLYAQMLGRGLRPLAETAALLGLLLSPADRRECIFNSRKPGVLVVDLVGVTGKHKLVTAADILGAEYPDEVIQLANTLAADRAANPDDDGMASVEELIEEAATIVAAAETERRKTVIMDVLFTKKTVSPFDLFDVQTMRERGWDKGKWATDAQLDSLRKVGVLERDLKKLTRAKATALLDDLRRRRDLRLCTYKQARTLVRFGYPVSLKFEEASRIIDRLIANNWRPLK